MWCRRESCRQPWSCVGSYRMAYAVCGSAGLGAAGDIGWDVLRATRTIATDPSATGVGPDVRRGRMAELVRILLVDDTADVLQPITSWLTSTRAAG